MLPVRGRLSTAAVLLPRASLCSYTVNETEYSSIGIVALALLVYERTHDAGSHSSVLCRGEVLACNRLSPR